MEGCYCGRCYTHVCICVKDDITLLISGEVSSGRSIQMDSGPRTGIKLAGNKMDLTSENVIMPRLPGSQQDDDYKTTNQINNTIIRLLGLAFLLPLLKYINQYTRKVMNTFWYILSNLNQILLAPAMFHVKHILRIKLNNPSSTGFLSIPSITSEYNASSPLCSITPLFSINQSSVEFYHTGTSGVPWLQEYVHRLS